VQETCGTDAYPTGFGDAGLRPKEKKHGRKDHLSNQQSQPDKGDLSLTFFKKIIPAGM
jgi:hypothetical protein